MVAFSLFQLLENINFLLGEGKYTTADIVQSPYILRENINSLRKRVKAKEVRNATSEQKAIS